MVKESDCSIRIFVKSDRGYENALIFSIRYAIIYDVSDCAAVPRGLRFTAFIIQIKPAPHRDSGQGYSGVKIHFYIEKGCEYTP